MHRPVLYLDVDGPLNPYAAKPERRPESYATQLSDADFAALDAFAGSAHSSAA